MMIEAIESKLASEPDPEAFFEDDPAAALKRYRVALHPDRFPGDPARAARATALMNRIEALHGLLADPPIVVKSKKRTYRLWDLIASGDVADVYRAISEGRPYRLKCSRVPGGAAMLAREAKVLERLMKDAGATAYARVIPVLCESIPVRDGGLAKTINVFVAEPGLVPVIDVHARHPQLAPRHLAWLFKRLLSALGLAHRAGVVHGAVVPPHVLVHPEGHGIQLIGWGQSVEAGAIVKGGSSAWLDLYPPEVRAKKPAGPSADIYGAARLMEWLSGDGFASCPAEMRRFFRSCLLPGATMRPSDAWGLHDEFDGVLRNCFGAPKYVPLEM